MERVVKTCNNPEDLDDQWNELAGCYYLRKEFLIHLQKHNFCSQLFYQLFSDGRLIAGTITYTVKTNLLTFLDIPTPVSFRVIGLPVSIASPPFVGDEAEMNYLLEEIISRERGLILGLNFIQDHLPTRVVNLRTLPNIIINLPSGNMEGYEKALRHPYRRRLHKLREKFKGVTSETTNCSYYNDQHHDLYLQVMKASSTKLEVLNTDAFKYLPDNFELTTIYCGDKMLFWHILCRDSNILYFFMCGMNYKYRDEYQIYHNSLFNIIESAMRLNYRVIDLGQTAEIAKMRIGGHPVERRMFLYHKNPLIFFLIKLFKRLITYNTVNAETKVFKKQPKNENIIRKARTFA